MMTPNLGDMITDLEESYVDPGELLAVLKSVRADVLNLHAQACKVGETFRFIRIGEDHPKETETREELDKVYTPLAKMIDALKEQVE